METQNANTNRFKDSIMGTDVDPGQDARSADQAACDVRQNVAIEVGQDEDVELVRMRD